MRDPVTVSRLQARSVRDLQPNQSERQGSGRREFLQATAAWLAAGASTLSFGAPAPQQPTSQVAPWYKTVYRRNVIDMHITDWNPQFLSEFDPETYVSMLRLSQVKSAVVYAQSHVGLCNFPTQVGRTHNGMKGKNHLARVIDLCRSSGIGVQLYYSVIFDRYAYEQHPDWRIILANGREASEKSRHGLNCPNSPYRDHVVALTEEMCQQFDFEGIRFDMTFWPAVCYCHHCERRFDREVGGALPKVIDWEDPRWVSFQRKREEWLADFAELLTRKVKSRKPKASVEHQASTYTQGWRLGVTELLCRQNDFLQGDFYGDALQGSFVRKLFYNFSPNLPYGFETSMMVALRNHTAKKSKELMRAKAYACLADGGAFIFIDAIDPVGTVNRSVYEQMSEVFNETKVYEKFLGGKLCQDIAVYLSLESKFDFADKGKSPLDPNLSSRLPHVDAAVSVCKALIENHLPYGVITKKNLSDLSRHRLVVLPNVLMMDAEEVEALRKFVAAGGVLYASKYTSLFTKDGKRQKDFLWADVFGASYQGETKENYTFIAPASGNESLFGGYTQKYPVGLDWTQLLVKAESSAKVLGKTVLPYTDPADPIRYASIHSNPPGIATDNPAVVLNQFRKGKAVYVAGELESHETCHHIFINLVRLLTNAFSFEGQAPKAVEISAFHQEDQQRYLINLVNFQKDLPNIPAEGIRVKFQLQGKTAKRLLLLPEGKPVPLEKGWDFIQFTVPVLETFRMFALEYG